MGEVIVMAIITILVPVGLILTIDGLIAREFYRVAKRKGFSELKYFWIPFFCPIIGYRLVIALPDLKQREILVKILVKMHESDTPVKQDARFESDELPDL